MSTSSYDSGSDDYEKGKTVPRPRPPDGLPPHVSFNSEVEMKSATLAGSEFSEEEIVAGSSKIKSAHNHATSTVGEDFSIHSIRPVQRPSRHSPPRNRDRPGRNPPERSFTIKNLRPVKSPSRDRPPPMSAEPIHAVERQRSFSLSTIPHVPRPSRARPSRMRDLPSYREEPTHTSFSISNLRPPPHRSISRRSTAARPVHDNRIGTSSDSELEYYRSRTNRTMTGYRERENAPVIVAADPLKKFGTRAARSPPSSDDFSLSTLEPVAQPSGRQRSPVKGRTTHGRSAQVEDEDSDIWSISGLGSAPRPSRRLYPGIA